SASGRPAGGARSPPTFPWISTRRPRRCPTRASSTCAVTRRPPPSGSVCWPISASTTRCSRRAVTATTIWARCARLSDSFRDLLVGLPDVVEHVADPQPGAPRKRSPALPRLASGENTVEGLLARALVVLHELLRERERRADLAIPEFPVTQVADQLLLNSVLLGEQRRHARTSARLRSQLRAAGVEPLLLHPQLLGQLALGIGERHRGGHRFRLGLRLRCRLHARHRPWL